MTIIQRVHDFVDQYDSDFLNYHPEMLVEEYLPKDWVQQYLEFVFADGAPTQDFHTANRELYRFLPAYMRDEFLTEVLAQCENHVESGFCESESWSITAQNNLAMCKDPQNKDMVLFASEEFSVDCEKINNKLTAENSDYKDLFTHSVNQHDDPKGYRMIQVLISSLEEIGEVELAQALKTFLDNDRILVNPSLESAALYDAYEDRIHIKPSRMSENWQTYQNRYDDQLYQIYYGDLPRHGLPANMPIWALALIHEVEHSIIKNEISFEQDWSLENWVDPSLGLTIYDFHLAKMRQFYFDNDHKTFIASGRALNIFNELPHERLDVIAKAEEREASMRAVKVIFELLENGLYPGFQS